MMNKRKFRTIDPKSLTTQQMHKYLLAAVAPRPIALASTIDLEGNINLSPFSFFNVFSANPPIMIFSPSRRGTDATQKHTYVNVKEIPEVCISIVNYDIVEQVSLSSTAYPKEVNEFEKSGLTALQSEAIKPPRVAESPVSFECKVNQVISLGQGAGSGNLIICEVIKFHISDSVLNDEGMIDSTQLDLVGRMGGIWYNRAVGGALFSIPKPLSTLGVGVDALPEHIQNSSVLTGNDLGRLGNVERLPSSEEVDSIIHSNTDLIESGDLTKIHRKAKDLIEQEKTMEALSLLFAAQV